MKVGASGALARGGKPRNHEHEPIRSEPEALVSPSGLAEVAGHRRRAQASALENARYASKTPSGVKLVVGVGIHPDEPPLRAGEHAGLGATALDIPPVAIDLPLLLDVFDEIGPFLPVGDQRPCLGS